MIDHTATCPNGYTALNWSQGGVSGYEQVFLNQPGPFLVGVVRDVIVDCPVGKVALGGGFDASNAGAGAGVSILASWPTGGSSSSWNVRVQPTTELDYVTAFVTCGNAS